MTDASAATKSIVVERETVVTWTLTPMPGGTVVRMEQSGFRPQDEGGYQAMSGGWPRIVEGLERAAGALGD